MIDRTVLRVPAASSRRADARAPRLRAVLLALTVALGACTTTPTTPPTLDLPQGKTTANDVALERWWTMFNDPLLTSYVDEALAHNLDLAAAMARIETARAGVTLASAALYPSVNLGVGASRTRSTQVGSNPLPPGFSPLATDYNIALQASYELDLWGKYRTAT